MSATEIAGKSRVIASKVGALPINIPEGMVVKVDESDRVVHFEYKSQTVTQHIHPDILAAVEDSTLVLRLKEDKPLSKKHWGTMRALMNNIVIGLHQGHEKKLVLQGVGYRVAESGNKIQLSLGFSHPVFYTAPEGIKIQIVSQTEMLIKGHDKQKVGQVASIIRSFRPPEPYKLKGVLYEADLLRKKKEVKKK